MNTIISMEKATIHHNVLDNTYNLATIINPLFTSTNIYNLLKKEKNYNEFNDTEKINRFVTTHLNSNFAFLCLYNKDLDSYQEIAYIRFISDFTFCIVFMDFILLEPYDINSTFNFLCTEHKLFNINQLTENCDIDIDEVMHTHIRELLIKQILNTENLKHLLNSQIKNFKANIVTLY